MKLKRSTILMVGPFPPPVHGMAAVNASALDWLRRSGMNATVINLAASSLDRTFISRLSRLPKVLWGLCRLTKGLYSKETLLYMSVSGGWGQIYELAFLSLARLRGIKIVLHHHSFAYLDMRRQLTHWLVRFSGADSLHITQSKNMASRLRGIYNAVNVASVSNAIFFVSEAQRYPQRHRLKTIGFLSNIAPEKGIFEFLDLCLVIQAKGLSLRALLAGPFQDSQTEQSVRKRLAELHCVEYLGPKYGVEKDAFYDHIDVLIFPTRYKNETEGIVNHEAMSRGIPVIAYGRGCIPEIISPQSGLVIDPEEPFVPAAYDQIKVWLNSALMFGAASKAARESFLQAYSESYERWTVLLADMAKRNDFGQL